MSNISLNTDTDIIEEQIKKCTELIKKFEQLEKHAKQIHFVTIKEFAEMRGCSIKIAQDIFNLPDFPRRRLWKRKSCFY